MKLNKVRSKIDQVDKKLAKLLNKRFLLVEDIKEIKQANKLEVENLVREEEIVAKNSVYIDDLYKTMYKEIYQTIFKVTKALQQ